MSKLIYFDKSQIWLFVLSIAFLGVSYYYHSRSKTKMLLVFLSIGAFLMFSFGACLDHFINVWDERFHALVAKNMMNHFFIPTLYDETALNMVYEPWDRFHIWLQKQPLFLWQITSSFYYSEFQNIL